MPLKLNLKPDILALIEGPNYAHVATIGKDGWPQVSPVWIEHDGEHIIVNTEQKRVKVRNLKRDPRVTISIQDMKNPYSYAQIKGKVVEITPEGGAEGIDRLAKKYLNMDKYPNNLPGDIRVQVKIEPISTYKMG